MNENIAREERLTHQLAAVAPAVNLAEERKKGFDAFGLKLCSYFLFTSRPRLNGEPNSISGFLRPGTKLGGEKLGLARGHSSAFSVPLEDS